MGGRALARSAAFLIIPRSFVVGVRSGIKSRIQPILGQLESFLNNEGRIRVVDQVIFGVAVILDRVANQSAQKRDVRPSSNLQEEVRGGCRPRKSRVYHNHLGVSVSLGFDGPLKSAG